MRLALIGLATVAAAVAADVLAAAPTTSLSSKNVIVRGKAACRVGSIARNKTLAQCNMIIEPMRYCLENPFWHVGREGPTTKDKARSGRLI
jgi:hypothetical protein